MYIFQNIVEYISIQPWITSVNIDMSFLQKLIMTDNLEVIHA